MDVPRVSIVVPVYNGRKTIGECIRSLLALDYPREEFEILIVDNASRDGTSRILRGFGEDVRILHERTRGPAAARNRGLREARGEIVAFTDADCTVRESWLREITRPLADPAVGIVGGKIRAREPSNDIELFGEQIHDHYVAIDGCRPPYAITMNWASPLSVLKQAGFFDESLRRVEDVDLTYRVLQAGYRVVFAPDAVVHHRNERTLWGLFTEGYAHGYHAVKVVRKHEKYLSTFPRAEKEYLYWDVFRFGKRAGKILGGLRDRLERR